MCTLIFMLILPIMMTKHCRHFNVNLYITFTSSYLKLLQISTQNECQK